MTMQQLALAKCVNKKNKEELYLKPTLNLFCAS